MQIKTKLKTLLSRSVLISAEKRRFLSMLADSLDEEQMQQLMQILKTEPKSIAKIMGTNFTNDSSGDFLKRFDELAAIPHMNVDTFLVPRNPA
jgi:hypothetical protein